MSKLETSLKSHILALAYPRHPGKHPVEHEKASRYVQDTLVSYGYQVTADPFEFEGATYHNWVATLPGDPTTLPLTIVGAHFDSVPDSPGADDNASGVAVMLEAARLYREWRQTNPASTSTSIQFVAFDLEECITVGSVCYAKRLKKENKQVRGMLSLEMLGFVSRAPRSQRYPKGIGWLYRSQGDFVALIGSFRSFGFLWTLRKALNKFPGMRTQSLLVPCMGEIITDVRRSDHAPFWDEGYPAVMVSDTSFYRNPNYHTPLDTIDTLDIPFMALITQALAGFLVS